METVDCGIGGAIVLGIVWDIHYNNSKDERIAAKEEKLTVVPPPAPNTQVSPVDDRRQEDNNREIKKYIASLDEIIAKDKNNAEAYKERGWAFSNIGDCQTAIRDLDRSISIHPTADAYCKRAWIYVILEDKTHAAKDAASALKLDPTNEDAKDARELACR